VEDIPLHRIQRRELVEHAITVNIWIQRGVEGLALRVVELTCKVCEIVRLSLSL
jgi:hypothetical protein